MHQQAALDSPSVQALFALLRAEMWQEPELACTLTAEEWGAVVDEAQRQAVAGLAISSLVRFNVALGQERALKSYSLLMQIKQRNAFMNKQMASFVGFMNKRELPFAVVKGQVVGSDYPNPDVRTSGDIDFYCDSTTFPKAKAAFEKMLGRDLSHDQSAKHVEFEAGGVIYELHSMLSEFAHKPYQDYLNRIVEEDVRTNTATVDVDGTAVPTLSPTMNALYIFVHIYYHLITSGVGLRQLCDLAVFIHAHRDEIDKAQLDEWLGGLGLRKGYTAMGAALVEALGLPEAEFPFALTEKDRKRGRKILKNMLRMGNFGHDARKTKKLGLLHSMETGWISLRQCLSFYALCPKDARSRVPYLLTWFLKRRTGHTD